MEIKQSSEIEISVKHVLTVHLECSCYFTVPTQEFFKKLWNDPC